MYVIKELGEDNTAHTHLGGVQCDRGTRHCARERLARHSASEEHSHNNEEGTVRAKGKSAGRIVLQFVRWNE